MTTIATYGNVSVNLSLVDCLVLGLVVLLDCTIQFFSVNLSASVSVEQVEHLYHNNYNNKNNNFGGDAHVATIREITCKKKFKHTLNQKPN